MGGVVQRSGVSDSPWVYPLRVRVKSLPQERELEGFDLSRFEVGQVYDVGQRLGELLIVLGHAVPDGTSGHGQAGFAQSATADGQDVQYSQPGAWQPIDQLGKLTLNE